MGVIREFLKAQQNGVSAADFVRCTNFDELCRSSSPAQRQQPAAAVPLRESLDDWQRRHLTQGATATKARPAAMQEESVGDWRVRRFKQASSADVALVATQDEPQRFASLTSDVLQESRLQRLTTARAAAARPAADRLEWVRRHRAR